ncbi:DUF4252 domain-containing protein [Roseimarinus sediminis]|uniref:DUF4252 domain-containing protein n=1 Tax=Roseimarinus sediminis TaxID=1610899 RepID=UPI003D257F6E
MKTLIQLGIILAMTLSSLLGFSQSQSDKIYDLFSGKDGVVNLSFSKSVIKPLEVFIDEDTKKVIYKMDKIKMLSYNERKGSLFADEVFERMLEQLDGKGYFTIDPDEVSNDNCHITLDDDDDRLVFIGHGQRHNMDEFHMLLHDDEMSLLFSFYGDITIEDLSEFGRFACSSRGFINQ